MEGDAGTVPVSPDGEQQTADTAETADTTDEDTAADTATTEPVPTDVADAGSGQSRLGRRHLVALCVVLVVLAAGLATAGYLGLRDHAASQAMARDNAEAIAAAKHCVLATQAPDSADIALAQQTILDCAAGEFRTQATYFAEIFVQAYRAAKVHIELTEMGAAVERNNPDGSVDVLVAFRVKVDNVETQGKEVGYRLRAQMVREDGQYRIGRLDQVAR
ncbi:membrane protein [Mycolicibacter terrae]|uniref:Membrane protein n=1 Tax=Mycolicibacter terrae TaxID=1788 RepID=A0AAD1I6G8_9MYCO|nr:Mce protein [Mycolicibacter terrae]BBX24511.1 membrane protein [Mycolicibacter terrae]SNV53304.1 Mce associated membrane protein [Mycolicibacter terrae]